MEGFRISDKSENVIAYLLTSFEKSGEYSGTGFFSMNDGLKDSVRFLTLKGYRNEHYYDRTKEENSQKAKESAINEIRSILTSAKIEPEKDEAYLKLAKDDSSYLVELLINRGDNSVVCTNILKLVLMQNHAYALFVHYCFPDNWCTPLPSHPTGSVTLLVSQAKSPFAQCCA